MTAGDLRSQLVLLLRNVAVLTAEGRAEPARAALREAVIIAEIDTVRRPFVEQPTTMRLLRDQGRRNSQAFATSIVEASAATGMRDAAGSQLIEPLSEHEREVLDYLPTRMSNKELASALYISVNTLKTHLSHVYTKLGAKDRDSAVAKAYELKLL